MTAVSAQGFRPCPGKDCPCDQILADDPFRNRQVWWCHGCHRTDIKGGRRHG